MRPRKILKSIPLPYQVDSTQTFAQLRHLSGAIFLDSCNAAYPSNRYDILAALPYIRVETKGPSTYVHQNGHVTQSKLAPFDTLKKLLNIEQSVLANPILQALPFKGGIIGYFAYELFSAKLNTLDVESNQVLMDAGIYDTFIIVDHLKKNSSLISLQIQVKSPVDTILECINSPCQDSAPFQLSQRFKQEMSQSYYAECFEQISAYILSGDCYQVNFSQGFNAPYQGDPWHAYKTLRQHSPAPFSAFISTNNGAILCHSPEQFIQLQGNAISTKPIKGTRPRHSDSLLDEQAKRALKLSTKDKAENLMIVDLMRNDIGRHAETGSIKVPKLWALESFSNVHHLVSTVTGKLAITSHALDLLQDSLPGGSITGAPKQRAMEIINELETQPRSIYCGSVGFISFNGDMNTNIAIRTLSCDTGTIRCWGGGGIVADSNKDDEYQESIEKVSNLMNALEKNHI